MGSIKYSFEKYSRNNTLLSIVMVVLGLVLFIWPGKTLTLAARILGIALLVGAAVSQVISNVPAALLLSGFTDNGRGLLLGVNIGGLGTPVASLASLISFKLYSHAEHARPGAFMRCFLAVNLGLLAVLLAFAYLL